MAAGSRNFQCTARDKLTSDFGKIDLIIRCFIRLEGLRQQGRYRIAAIECFNNLAYSRYGIDCNSLDKTDFPCVAGRNKKRLQPPFPAP